MDTLEYYESKKDFNVFVASTFSDLLKYRQKGEQSLFNNLLFKDLHQVKRYIKKRVATALSKGNLPKGKYKVDDFIDQLFITVYDNFNEVATKEDLHPWLFKKANGLLEDSIMEEEFDDYFLKNIDDYSKPEWDEMEEKFSTDGDGDLVMLDELDDTSLPKNDYVLNHVFIEDDKKEFMEKLDRELGEESIRKHTHMILHFLPLPMRTVFELATEYEFSVNQIAMIRNQSVKEVKKLLDNARKTLEASLFNRYGTQK